MTSTSSTTAGGRARFGDRRCRAAGSGGRAGYGGDEYEHAIGPAADPMAVPQRGDRVHFVCTEVGAAALNSVCARGPELVGETGCMRWRRLGRS
jgi:hypothetical protein